MNQSLCPRCRLALQKDGDNTLVFCPHCGAPQVRLSEELRMQAEQQLGSGSADQPQERPPLPPDPNANRWRSLLRYSAVTAGIASVFTLLLPPLALVVPPIVLAVYAARNRGASITAGLGASVGVVCGLFTSLALLLVETLGLLALRFGNHSMGEIDNNFNSIVLRTKAQMLAQGGSDGVAFLDRIISVPEYRVGLFLAGMGMFIATLLVFSTLSGALAGYLRRHAGRA